MRQINIDGVKNDVRVLCTGPHDSEDAGLVNGVPIDPPDWTAGWVLVDLWVEHDTVQEKGEKGQVTTKKVNPAFYQIWVKPKTKVKGKRLEAKRRDEKPPAAAPKKRGRKPKPPETPPPPIETEGQNVLESLAADSKN
jgi:hypothetical protein